MTARRPGPWNFFQNGGTLRASDEGFALVFAVWAVGLLSLLIVTYVVSSRARSMEAFAALARARAQSASHSGVMLAIRDLSLDLDAGDAPTRGPAALKWTKDGSARVCSPGDDFVIQSRVFDEGGKIDLNTSAPELLTRFLASALSDPTLARDLARLLLERRNANSGSANQPAAPASPATPNRSRAFASIYDIDRVATLPADSLTRILPHVTVHSRASGIDPEVAPIALLRLLAGTLVNNATRQAIIKALPPAYVTPSAKKYFLVSVLATSETGAAHQRDALVELARGSGSAFKIHEWREPSPPSLPQETGAVRVGGC